MHLPNGDHIMRFRAVSKEPVKVKVQSNGTVKTPENRTYTNTISHKNGHVPLANEVHISHTEELALDAILDTVLTAWTILVQRYQRDQFHRFTWTIKNTEIERKQCISARDLDLPNQKVAKSLKARVSDVRLKSINVDKATVILNDGTKEEV